MYEPTIPRYCQILLEYLDGPMTMELDFGQNDQKKPGRLDGLTFKHKDTLAASKLRELEALLSQPFYALLDELQKVNKRYALVSYAGVQLHPKEDFFLQVSSKMLGEAIGTVSIASWQGAYPRLRLVPTNVEQPPQWNQQRLHYVALAEFLVRELGFYSGSLEEPNDNAEEAFSAYLPPSPAIEPNKNELDFGTQRPRPPSARGKIQRDV